jgi:hypothetical protein
MQDLLDQFKAILEKVRDLERAFLNIKTLVFPTDEGRLSIPKYDGDPASPADGDIWYDYTSDTYRGKQNGTKVTFDTTSD